jgi:hypothetical protein
MLTQEDFAQLDNRYVLKDDCNDRHSDTAKEISELTISQTKINTQLGMLIKINAAELGAVGTAIIAAIMKLILK